MNEEAAMNIDLLLSPLFFFHYHQRLEGGEKATWHCEGGRVGSLELPTSQRRCLFPPVIQREISW